MNMSTEMSFESVWDALEDNPVRALNLRLRSGLLIHINEELDSLGLSQSKIAEMLEITQPRVSALRTGKIENFRLDSLVDIAHRLGLRVSLRIAACQE